MYFFQSCKHLFKLIFLFFIYHFYVSAENLICQTWENQNGCLSKIDDCFFLWTNGGTVEVSSKSYIKIFEFNSNPKNLTNVKGSCTSVNDTKEINLIFVNKYHITLNMFVKNRPMESDWIMDKFILNIKDNEEFQYEMNTESINAPKAFSYSCSELLLLPKINSTNDEVKLIINRFQIQPFSSNDTIFAESFDCSTWFSLPMWMGLIGILLFTIICAIGICYLMDIKTMDRFENPKSKPLTIAVSE